MKKNILTSAVIIVLLCITSFSCKKDKPASASVEQKVFTNDIDNFWIAYDNIKKTDDNTEQLSLINSLYIEKGTEGLRAFIKERDLSAELWVNLINTYPKFWNSIRANTLSIKAKAKEIDLNILKFKTIYPELKEGKIYFTIGGLTSGGTISDNLVLIGTEVVTGNPTTDVSEFPDEWLGKIFKNQNPDNIISVSIHEYVHTQQKGDISSLLGAVINEGSCDFIAELVTGKPLQTSYMQYGKDHEEELKEKFEQEMFTDAIDNWLFNGSKVEYADLGYFMGYQICKSYYQNSTNKKEAIKQIIELDYSDNNAVEDFLAQSKYYSQP
ncbi:MAG: DUF2268 domain-containing putative Zn-dependent protease [Daejeonella sp.]